MATIQQVIGKVNPNYAKNGQELLRKYGGIDEIPADEVEPQPLSEHVLGYDSSSETLEPIYFFILDLIEKQGFETEKFVDNFSSTPGSGHFSELGQRATIMQQQGTKILGDVNTVLRSVLNLIYDLREFRIRLQNYNDLKSKDKAEAARLSMKQIWMDKVDINKGNSSVKAMAFQGGFQTLIDAFLIAKDEKDVEKIDLNDRVKRILMGRIQEFNIWLKESERELRKRYELEKSYLRSQVNSLKLYSRWVKPYLKAAQALEQKDLGRNPNFVKTFNTIILELSLLGKSKIDIKDEAVKGNLPEELRKIKVKKDYYKCILMEFSFRGIPQRVGQQSHYAFGGKAEVKFIAYALNSDELAKITEEYEKSEVGEVLGLIEGATTESLKNMEDEINFFLEEDKESEDEDKGSTRDKSNPFAALFGFYDKKSESKKSDKNKEGKKKVVVRSESWIEKNVIRKFAEKEAKDKAFDLFDVYKSAHGMLSYT